MGGANPLSIARAAAEAQDRVALIADDDGASYSFGELAERAGRLAGQLRAGVESRVDGLDGMEAPRVAIVAGARVDTVVAVLACWEQGWIPALIHPRLADKERRRLVAEVEPAAVLDEHFAVAGEPAVARPVDRGPSAIAALVHTSGTAGAARGVLLPRSAFEASARASEANLGWRDDDRWLVAMPLAHVGGLSVLARALIARRTVVLARVQVTAPDRLIEVVARHRVTLASLVPTQLRRVFDAEPGYRPPAHLRAVLLGGAASSPALLAEAAERGWPVLATYGLTEACSQVATQSYGTRPGAEQGCGPPLAGVRVRIAGGEVQVAGPTLMTGYFARGAPPIEPFVDGGWFPTGDLGELDGAGRLHIRGRRKELIVTGGENVHPLEVEQGLEACPEVAAACAFGVADPLWGEIVAAAVVARDPAIGDAELRTRVDQHARAALAPHQRPRRLARVRELATTASGKLDRRATVEQAGPLLEPAATRRP